MINVFYKRDTQARHCCCPSTPSPVCLPARDAVPFNAQIMSSFVGNMSNRLPNILATTAKWEMPKDSDSVWRLPSSTLVLSRPPPLTLSRSLCLSLYARRIVLIAAAPRASLLDKPT